MGEWLTGIHALGIGRIQPRLPVDGDLLERSRGDSGSKHHENRSRYRELHREWWCRIDPAETLQRVMFYL